jgi:hypothetical protein
MLRQKLYKYIAFSFDEFETEVIGRYLGQDRQVKDISLDQILEEMTAKRELRHHAGCLE